ncbi:hypothetical protein [Salinibacillus xinjiangensis]|uniref:Uncharacterized protein n=1 Tax=Salinibacillus xinjiangensis TaxID=1229268 RepID=A0A6G1XA61_9BACI|nr:hypothetical protein [Salinibacillus xinjiangensis]MRG87893.1 hypothetical protein [Salinibacillus xinjiangensis]
MVELLLFSLIAGLFIYGVAFSRVMTRRQVDQTLKTLVDNWEPKTKKEKVLSVPEHQLVLQESVKQMKD